MIFSGTLQLNILLPQHKKAVISFTAEEIYFSTLTELEIEKVEHIQFSKV